MRTRLLPLSFRFFTLGCALTILVLLFARAMFKRLDHDEHQFIASAALLARRSLLPYRDYPHFHMPYLIVIYAMLLKLTDHLLLAARLFSTACGVMTVGIVAWITGRLFESRPARQRRMILAAVVSILISNPLFLFTSGRSWNHDLPTVLTLLAFVAVAHRGLKNQGSACWMLAAGVMMGLAVGLRLTFAPPAAAFFVLALACPWAGPARRIALALAFTAGALLALLPCAPFIATGPEQFVFGNFEYPALNTAYRMVTHYDTATSPLEKIVYVFANVLVRPGNAALLLLLVFTAMLSRQWRSFDPQRRFQIASLIILIEALLISAFAPSPLFVPYFYSPMVLLLLLVLYIAADATASTKLSNRWMLALGVVVAVSIPGAIDGYRDVLRVGQVQQYVPMKVHAVGTQIHRLAGAGPVLTLAPIYPLEGGSDIYEELASGAFAWRIGPYMTEAKEQLCKVLDADDLDQTLAHRPPGAVVLAAEDFLDTPLQEYAQRHHIPLLSVTKDSELSDGSAQPAAEMRVRR